MEASLFETVSFVQYIFLLPEIVDCEVLINFN